ncbi:hypothetical protein MKX08_000248 [Trichoderma sp. CBMAI-0020]|nr:hypothetical protein MKX08_000248 [Trichoderma sp. CBMAI-0020]
MEENVSVKENVSVNESNRRPGSAKFTANFFSSVTFDDPHSLYANSHLRSVVKGVSGSGLFQGKPCVIKWFKSDSTLEKAFFILDIKAVHLALEIVDDFDKNILKGKAIKGGTSGNEATITDPVILSRDRGFGVTDLGQRGIDNFFGHHVCNEYCGQDWIKPSDPIRCFEPNRRTTMIEWRGYEWSEYVDT